MRYWVLIGLAMTLALARGQTVEFPVGYYFYEEIAQMMSVGGRRVVCAPELNDSMTLLRLKPREWRQARQILENTLEVRFRAVGNNQWVIERPPALVKQEQRLRRALARALEDAIRQNHALARQIWRPELPTEKILEALETRSRRESVPQHPELERAARLMMVDIIHLFREAPLEELLAEWRTLRRFQKRLETRLPPIIIPANALFSPSQTCTGMWCRAPAGFQRDSETPAFSQPRLPGFAQQPMVEEFSAEDLLRTFRLPPAMLRIAAQQAQMSLEEWAERYRGTWFEEPSERQVWALYNLCGLVYGVALGYITETLLERTLPSLDLQQVIEQGTVARMCELEMDTELLALWLDDPDGQYLPLNAPHTTRVRVLATAQWVDTRLDYEFLLLQHDRNSFPPKILRGSTGDWLTHEQLARLLRVEAPAQERKLQDALPQHKVLFSNPLWSQHAQNMDLRSGRFYDKLYQWAKRHDQEIAVELILRWNGQWGSWRGLFLGEAPFHEVLRSGAQMGWTLIDRYETVWTLRNFAAFIHRGQRVPIAAILRLYRSELRMADYKRFYQSVDFWQAARLSTATFEVDSLWLFGRQPNRNALVIAPVYAAQWMMLYILEQLSPAEWEQLQRAVDSPLNPAPAVSLRQLPAHAQKRLGELLVSYATLELGPEQYYNPFADASRAVWYDLLSGRLPIEHLLDGLTLTRADYGDSLSSLQLVYNPPGYLKPQSVMLLSIGLPRESLSPPPNPQ